MRPGLGITDESGPHATRGAITSASSRTFSVLGGQVVHKAKRHCHEQGFPGQLRPLSSGCFVPSVNQAPGSLGASNVTGGRFEQLGRHEIVVQSALQLVD